VLVKDVVRIIHRVAPPDLAADWDNSGLQVGDLNQPVRKIGLALDVTARTLDLALAARCDLLLAHHPLLFKPLKNILFDREPGSLIKAALSAGLSIISAHTNWDAAARGVAQALADRLELTERRPLEAVGRDFYKLVVFVPVGYENPLREALFQAGAGHVGDYDQCWFGAPGEGGYCVPDDGQPFVGQRGLAARTPESRLEVIVPRALAQAAAEAVLKHHPYEEPAFEFHEVKLFGRDQGLGLLGRWEAPRDLLAEVGRVAQNFKWAGPRPERVERVALLPGSGGSFIRTAHSLGAQALITGDVSYHQALEAESLGLTLVDVGHFEAEWPGVQQMARVLWEEFERKNYSVECEVLAQPPAWKYGQAPNPTPQEA
jgi:dinuclear metal center YbgI/SA1388 family protein